MICENILRNGISNETIHDMTGMEEIEVFLREQRLCWFENVGRIDKERAPVDAKKLAVEGSKKGQPKNMERGCEKRHAG